MLIPTCAEDDWIVKKSTKVFGICVHLMFATLLGKVCTFEKVKAIVLLITKTSQELRMLSSVTINCQITKIVMNSGSQLSEL